mmetsp:Transcript_18892/g.29580  ORF Transcript_18892/g.29580 Transcript_18892/m.29580 type:complete len:89 (+) Transcript_18892:94-360(+)
MLVGCVYKMSIHVVSQVKKLVRVLCMLYSESLCKGQGRCGGGACPEPRTFLHQSGWVKDEEGIVHPLRQTQHRTISKPIPPLSKHILG